MATRKPGKYDAVLKTLQKDVPEQSEYQTKVEAEKERLRSGERALDAERENTHVLELSLSDWNDAWSHDGAPESHTPESLAKLYIRVTSELEKLDAVAYDRNVRLKAIEQMLIDSHEADQPGWGLYGASDHTVKLASGACIDVLTQPSVRFVDREAFRQWCATPPDKCLDCGGSAGVQKHHLANDGYHPFRPGAGLEGKMQLPTMTRDSITKERLAAGVPIPDGLEVKAVSSVKYRRA